MKKRKLIILTGLIFLIASLVCLFDQGSAQMDPGGTPHYFGPYANWAYSPLPTGAVTNVMLTSGGSGYTSPTVTIEDLYGTGTGASASATVDPATGAITSITLSAGGSGYSAPQVVITDATTGTGAAAIATIGGALTGGLTKFIDALPNLTIAVPDTTSYPAGGSGYTSTPTITITDATGTGATATATVAGGVVTAITITNPGTGYSANPVVTFSGGGATSQAVAIATVDTVPTSPTFGQITGITLTGADYYEIELGEYTQQMHTNLPLTTLRGYRQINAPAGNPAGSFSYLGPVIVAQRNKPVRIMFINNLATGVGGNLFIPVDTTIMGSGMGPGMAGMPEMDPQNPMCGQSPKPMDCYTENRATLHLHGNNSPWISDGTPHQWITPASETTPYPQGVSVYNVPDMPDAGIGNQTDGVSTFYYTNQQSARLQFYHDHSYGITRLNVYVGEAAGYLITDLVEQDMINGTNDSGVNPSLLNVLPGIGIPLVIQDKSFVDPTTIAAQDPTWMGPVTDGSLWYPHVYMPNQNPYDIGGMNAFGRWHYGPWFWPPTTNIAYGPIPNPYCLPTPPSTCSTTPLPPYDCSGAPGETPCMPATPNLSTPMEAFQDTPEVNGMAYPYLDVEPKAYRFRILSVADDRFFNLQMYQATSIISSITVDSGGSGYIKPTVTLVGGTTGTPATATATVVNGVITAITLNTVGSGYTSAPTVTITDPTGSGANATATVYTGLTEVGMVPANDGREGGVPDLAMAGPEFIQIGTEGGFLPAPVVLPNQPVEWNYDPTTFDFGNVNNGTLILGPAERADVIVDFSAFAGKTIILYNDSPAPFPALDPRYDYYTLDPDQTDVGGAPTTQPGYGPNTRTIMAFNVGTTVTTPTPAVTLANLQSVFAKSATKRGVFEVSQDEIIVPEARYNSAYNKTFPLEQYFRIFDSISKTFQTVSGVTVTRPIEPKAIQDEMGEAFDMDYGRQNSMLGLELPFTVAGAQQFMLYPYPSPPVEIIKNTVYGTPLEVLSDGTQIWKITHNGVDTHTIHTHLFNAQLINRVAWDNNIRPPDANELGWKETFRVNPLQDTILALRPIAPTNLPFQVPNSIRLIDVTKPDGAPLSPPSPGLFFDPNGDPVTAFGVEGQINNHYVNFGWEYVYHCHLLAHEEMDMMHSVAFAVEPEAPSNLVATVLTGPLSVNLTWTDNSLNETNFKIQRATDAGFTLNLTNILVDPDVTTFNDTSVAGNTTYYYRVNAVNTVGDINTPNFPTETVNSAFSNTAMVSTPAAGPAAPTNLTATIMSATQIRLQWTDASNNETRFTVWRSVNGGAYTQIGTINRNPAQSRTTGGTVTFNNNDTAIAPLDPGNIYTYYVIAVNALGSSLPSNSATVNFSAPAAPTNLTGSAVRTNLLLQDRVTLNWFDNANNETGFQIQRSTNANFRFTSTFNVGANVTTFTQNVSRAFNYYYRVRARNAVGNSGWSNVVFVTTP